MSKGSFIRAEVCAALCCAAALALSGCFGLPHSHREIESYVRQTYGIENFTVSKESTPVTDRPDSVNDYIWTVTEDDGTRFRVLDDGWNGSAGRMQRRLHDDRNDVYFRRLIENADISGFMVRERTVYFPEAYLYATFHSRAELRGLTEKCSKLAENVPAGVKIPFRFDFIYPGRAVGPDGIAAENTDYRGDSYYSVDLFDPEAEEIYPGLGEDRLLDICIDMHYSDVLAEYSAGEIHDRVVKAPNAIGCRQKDGGFVFYNDLLMTPGSCVSFPTMYDLLKRNGYPVDGTMEHYSFDGIDGVHYEIEYDPNGDGGYSFTADGQERLMNPSYERHIFSDKFYEMTGIYIDNYYKLRTCDKEGESLWVSGE